MIRAKSNAHLLFTALLIVTAAAFLCGCTSREEKAVSESIRQELELLETQDPDQLAALLIDSSLMQELNSPELSEQILEVFPLFFQDFDYRIQEIEVDREAGTASAQVLLETIDAKALAKDYTSRSIVKQLQNQANPSRVEYSLEDYYLTLGSLLSENDYDIVRNSCTVELTKTDEGQWSIRADDELENALVGGFVTYAADPELFTPEEIVSLHYDTIKSFDTEQMNQFLSLDKLFSADDEYKRTIAKALAAQILRYLDYEILSSENDGLTATVTMNVTSCDSLSIIRDYRERVASYTATSQALADGMPVRLSKANQMLIDSINGNTASASTTITLTLINDGTNWKLQMDDAVAEGLLGSIDKAVADISTSPRQTDEDAESSS